mmetsp:Transcript_7728/g.16920  ORF Transcript_7728/g.16920 Transcript_7728/m.16920 type:complete len:108 (+) Transcript_7728:150-473(+)
MNWKHGSIFGEIELGLLAGLIPFSSMWNAMFDDIAKTTAKKCQNQKPTWLSKTRKAELGIQCRQPFSPPTLFLHKYKMIDDPITFHNPDMSKSPKSSSSTKSSSSCR